MTENSMSREFVFGKIKKSLLSINIVIIKNVTMDKQAYNRSHTFKRLLMSRASFKSYRNNGSYPT